MLASLSAEEPFPNSGTARQTTKLVFP